MKRAVDTSQHPVSPEVAAALAAFVAEGAGPTHSALSIVFDQTGYGYAAPYTPNSTRQQLNKADRVRKTVQAAMDNPRRSRDLIEGILSEYRAGGLLRKSENEQYEKERFQKYTSAKEAFMRISWELTESGEIRRAGVTLAAATKDRPAIQEQLERLRRGSEDPALMLGTAKEMLESTAKYVCNEFSMSLRTNISFDELWHHARERLGLLPQQVNLDEPGASELRDILQSCWNIALMANKLRNIEGTGHGRILPTAIRPNVAHFVVRESCSVVELVLETLDNMMQP